MNLTPPAKKIWESIPADIRVKLLNNAYCVNCSEGRGIAKVEGTVEKGDLILRGICTRCSGPVARLIEHD